MPSLTTPNSTLIKKIKTGGETGEAIIRVQNERQKASAFGGNKRISIQKLYTHTRTRTTYDRTRKPSPQPVTSLKQCQLSQDVQVGVE